MRSPRSLVSDFSYVFRRHTHFGCRPLAGLMLACSSWGCTLITDVDREKIPVPVQPPFTEVDAGPQPPVVVPDASVLDAGIPDDAAGSAADAGDAPDASELTDADAPSDAG
jgi:hypothetical protein